MTAPSSATVVLVHGAWHGEECWLHVGRHLRAAGVPWRALTLPSTGPWPGGQGAAGGFGADVAAVLGLITAVGSDVVLCGHGYGGMVISEAGNHPAVTRLVYLAALCPLPGESAATLLGRRWTGPSRRWLVSRSGSSLPVAWARRALYGDLPPARAAELAARLRPTAAAVFATPAQRPAWRSKPSLYVMCGRDRVLGDRRSRLMADRVVHSQIGHARYLERHVVTLDTGHAPFFAAPGLVADVVGGRF